MTVIAFEPHRTAREEADRVEQAEIAAGWYFNEAVKRQRAEYDASMDTIRGCVGPRYHRERDAARAKWANDTAEARALFDASVECLLSTGELSEELDNAWTELCQQQAVAHAMADAAE